MNIARLRPWDVRTWTRTQVLAYCKERGLSVSLLPVRGSRDGESTWINIGAGAGTGPSYRAALMDLLRWEECERWRKGAQDLGLASRSWPEKKVRTEP